MKETIFNIFILMTVIPSLWVAFSSNIVHAAFSLLFTLFGVAGLYVLLGADFIAVVQVIIYIGGILVLIIFGVMMTQKGALLPLSIQLPGRIFAAVLAGIVLVALLISAVTSIWPLSSPPRELQATAAGIGNLLLGKYLIPFELASVFLLAALIGAVLIVRRSIKGE